jgi:hypothetical protein
VGERHKDYSATPLPKKLGISAGARVLLVNPPDGFVEALEELPAGVRFLRRRGSDLDVVVAFATTRRHLEVVPVLAGAIAPAGRLWLAWPKKVSNLKTELDFDAVQGAGLSAGLVDNKSASVTNDFQGLQFVYRLEDRPARRR